MVTPYNNPMQVLSRATLRTFWERHPTAEKPLRTWLSIAEQASWSAPAEERSTFGGNVDFVADNRAIFDIGGNKFRLIVHIAYRHHRVLVKFIGTHAKYDRIDPETVNEHSAD